MAALPETRPTVDAIYRAHEAKRAKRGPSRRLGASAIGTECGRAAWYAFRWALLPEFDGRTIRTFQTGDIEENRIKAELRAAGVTVSDVDPATGKQWGFTAIGGHFVVYLDGVLLGLLEAPKTWHNLEIKSAKTKRFIDTKKKGVRVAEPKYYAQTQIEMGLAEPPLKRTAYFVVCKETDELHLERIEFDRVEFDRLMARARQIITSPEPLTPISSDPFTPPCGFCDFAPLCYEEKLPEVNCRTCAHSTPVVEEGGDGRWECSLTGETLSYDAQRKGCEEHVYIPPLIPFATPIDSTDGAVLYQLKRKGGGTFANVGASAFPAADVPHYSSAELRAMPAAAVGEPVVEEARRVFGAAEETKP